jgi:protein-arginine kinase activator protein McsA
MRCIMCGAHATFTHTLFTGTTPHKVNLCDPCAQKSQASDHMAKIKAAPDKAAKGAAVDAFLRVVEGDKDAPEARA